MRIVLVFSLLIQISYAQLLSTSGSQIVDDNNQEILLRGVGLGGWMLQEGYMMNSVGGADTQYEFKNNLTELIGSEETEIFYDNWLANFVTQTDIEQLSNLGYNSVRLAMHYNLFTLPIQQEPVLGENTWLDKGFEMVDDLLDWCENNQMYLILDLHAAPGGQGYDSGISDYNPLLPSLWESDFNKSKTVALWGQLADRYKDEPWIGGYDLINEVNWNLGTYELRDLYQQITTAIRSVDSNHIIFIEGNWFANDFTGLTPPWDSNMVYSFHKYWSYNNEDSLDWVLGLRDQYNVPLWCGETGENSNTWYRDAFKLYEDNNIGWASWPFKRIQTIVAPYSISSNSNYEAIINYWKGESSAPTVSNAIAGLSQLTTDLLNANTTFYKDVIDAQLRLPGDDTLMPYTDHQIPGLIYLSDYDLGINGIAYNDEDYVDYSIDTGAYEAWNKGWNYRNDGVDIQSNNDTFNSNGYHIGYLNDGEWMNYTVNIAATGFYDLSIRYAAPQSGGQLKLYLENVDVTDGIDINNSGGWSSFVNSYYQGVYLESGTHVLKVAIVGESEFNVGSIEFLSSNNTPDFGPLSAETLQDNKTIKLVLNHPIQQPQDYNISDFDIKIDGVSSSITSIETDPSNERVILFEMTDNLNFQQNITMDHIGAVIISTFDNYILSDFSDFPVTNSLAERQIIPGRIQAENFIQQSGLSIEATTDIFGGQNIGSTDSGDFAEYLVYVNQTGIYDLDIRYSSSFQQGILQLDMINSDNTQFLGWYSIPVTGGWQNWFTLSNEIELSAGAYTLRMTVLQPGFNLNWFNFNYSDLNLGIDDNNSDITMLKIHPNPVKEDLYIDLQSKTIDAVLLFDLNGRQIFQRNFKDSSSSVQLILPNLETGLYLVHIISNNQTYQRKLIKQ